ncbi:MAG: hypothetical protein Q8J88_00165 [Bacteroidales bacterium]|nr:hypothetical protein [Bacteroidales bacterium]
MKCPCSLQRSIHLAFSPSIVVLVIVLGILISPVFAQQIKINSGAWLKSSGVAYIKINNGDLINEGTYTKGSETVVFSGTATSIISGSSNVNMNNLLVATTGGLTTQLELLTTNDLSIGTGSKFTVNSSTAVTVNGTLTNDAGNTGFLIKSDATGTASLIHNTDGIAATVERYISGEQEAWHFLSSPIAIQNMDGSWLPSGTYANGTGYDLYLWNEPNRCWIYKLNTTSTINWNTVHPGSEFIPSRGYLYSVQASNPTKEFAGNLNSGSLNYGLTSTSDTSNLKGFNLVGNPYPSSIDWQAFSGWSRNNLVTTGGGYDMWIWNPAANNYGVFNSFTGIGTNSVTRYIAPMQGYFVLAASTGILGLNNTVRVHDGAGNWFKNSSNTAGMLSLTVQSEKDNSSDQINLLFGFNSNQAGATKLFSHVISAPSLFLPIGSEYCSVQYLTKPKDNAMVPVMFKPGKDGNYTFQCDFDPYEFEIVMLEDRLTHYIQDMKTFNSYRFQSSTADDASRFILHFAPDNEATYTDLPARIYSDGLHLIIDLSLVGNETEAYVYDAIGRLLMQTTLQGLTLHELTFNVKTQIVIVNLKNPQGNKSLKLIYPNKSWL